MIFFIIISCTINCIFFINFSYADNFSHDEVFYLVCFIFSRDCSPRYPP